MFICDHNLFTYISIIAVLPLNTFCKMSSLVLLQNYVIVDYEMKVNKKNCQENFRAAAEVMEKFAEQRRQRRQKRDSNASADCFCQYEILENREIRDMCACEDERK